MAEIVPMQNHAEERRGCGCCVDHGRPQGRGGEKQGWKAEVECELARIAEEGEKFYVEDVPVEWTYVDCARCGAEARYDMMPWSGALGDFFCHRCLPMAEVLFESFPSELDLSDRMISIRS